MPLAELEKLQIRLRNLGKAPLRQVAVRVVVQPKSVHLELDMKKTNRATPIEWSIRYTASMTFIRP